jgi:hypothetical protein
MDNTTFTPLYTLNDHASTNLEFLLRTIVLVTVMIMPPFVLAYIFQIATLPKGYSGIRNEQLKDQDREAFDMWKFSAYDLIETKDDY